MQSPGAVARLAWLVAGAAAALLVPAHALAESHVVIVRGLAGGAQYEAAFDDYAQALRESALRAAGREDLVVLLSGDDATRARVREILARLAKRARPDDTVALLIVGHGSFDGHQYKLNLRGPDVTAEELAKLLDAVRARRQLVVNTTGASGASGPVLERDGRVVITATRSGNERITPRFPEYFVASLADPAADSDKNGWVTAAEAFAYAQRQVEDAFERDTLLATEHAELRGTGAETFRLARSDPATAGAVSGPSTASASDAGRGAAAGAVDPERAALLARRSELDGAMDSLRARRGELTDEAYFGELEMLLQQIAEVDVQLELLPAPDAETQSP